jgi:uncharacterized membrane-anchored protein YhcB (DUF1043 family)
MSEIEEKSQELGGEFGGEQQKESAAPEKAEKSERPEEAPVVASEPAKAVEAAPAAIEIPAIEIAAIESAAASEPVPAAPARRWPSYLARAATVLAALGIGWAAGHAATTMRAPAADPAHQALMAIDWAGFAAGLQTVRSDSTRMAADLQALKGSLTGLKETADRAKQEAAGRFGQVAERLERIHKTDQEVAAKLAGLAERLEKAERDSHARLAAAVERLEKSERALAAQAAKPAVQAALQPPAPAAPPVPAADAPLRTGSIPDQALAEGGKSEQPKADKAAPIEGWVLREVYDGVALIEGRNRRLLEIAPGQSLAGVGRVESIERRGRSWVVVTTRGVITSQPW